MLLDLLQMAAGEFCIEPVVDTCGIRALVPALQANPEGDHLSTLPGAASAAFRK